MRSDRLTVPLLLLTAACSGVALFHAGAGAFFRIPRNFNEGWNAYLAEYALTGRLYFDLDSFITNVYPPLSFYLAGGLGLILGDAVFAGRLLSGAALAVVTLDIYLVLRLFAAEHAVAAACAIAFPGYMALGFEEYIATNDPHWLGEALMLTALALFVRSRGRSPAAAVLMVAAGLTKHMLIPIPLAATLWIVLYERPALRVWIAACAAAALPALALIWLVYGGNAFESMLLQHRGYDWRYAVGSVYTFVIPAVPFLALYAAGGRPRDDREWLIVYYAAAALAWGVYTRGAVGVAPNSLFDFYIAAALLTGLAMGRLQAPRPAALVAVLAPLALAAPQLAKPHRVLEQLWREEAAARQDIDTVAAAAGPVLCHTAALCYWAGKPYAFDAFNAGQKAQHDPSFADKVDRALAAHRFALIQVKGEATEMEIFAPALAEHYVQTKSRGPHRFYSPRP